MIPPDLSDIWNDLKHEWLAVTIYHRLYGDLFEHNEQRIEMLNETAPNAFFRIQRMLHDTLVLQVCRFIEPSGNGTQQKHQKRNLYTLLDMTDISRNSTLVDILKNSREDLDERYLRLKEIRNMHIAHIDAEVDHRPHLHRATKREITDLNHAIDDINQIFNHIHEHFFIQTIDQHTEHTGYRFDRNFIQSDAQRLLDVLAMGLAYRERMQAEILDAEKPLHGHLLKSSWWKAACG